MSKVDELFEQRKKDAIEAIKNCDHFTAHVVNMKGKGGELHEITYISDPGAANHVAETLRLTAAKIFESLEEE